MLELSKRLNKLRLDSNTAIHFEIGKVNDYELLDIFLFQVILIGSFGHLDYFFHMPKKFTIYIEIANTWNNQIQKYLSIIKLFANRTNIGFDSRQNIQVSSDLNSPIQLVCNYLLAYDKGTLMSKDLKPERGG